MGLTQIIVVGICLMFDINFGCIYSLLYSVGGMKIGFGGFDQYYDNNILYIYYFQTLKIIDVFLCFVLFPTEAWYSEFGQHLIS